MTERSPVEEYSEDIDFGGSGISAQSYSAKYQRKMGGLAFADEKPPLHTPRMLPAVYTYARDHLLRALRAFYALAQCPIEAPGKTDYGDIDILVTGPLHDFDSDEIAAVIGAAKHKKTAGSQTTHFAVPWPKLSHPPLGEDSIASDNSNAASHDIDEKYIQLDLHLCTPSSFTWEFFHQSHGDFWNIIGCTIRRLGLTPSDSGFYIRIEEIEARNKTAARILLTTSPAETLKFLGLDETRYWQKFETVDELFAYAARCRFFNPNKYDPARRTRGDLKANDRARARKRAMFRMWIEEYLPAHADDAPADTVAATMSREAVVEEAKKWFAVADEYEERRMKGLMEISRAKMWTQIKKELGIGEDSIGAVVRGVKRRVLSEEGRPPAEMTTWQRAYAQDDFDVIVQWVREDWKEIEEKQRAYEKETSTQNLLAKLERLKAEGKADGSARLGKAKAEVTADEGGRGACQDLNGSA